jgi:hypothetical protein
MYRPAWEEGWTRERLEMNEQKIFREYVTRHLLSFQSIVRG